MPAVGSPVSSITKGCCWASATPCCARPIAKPSKPSLITICCEGKGVLDWWSGGVVEWWSGGVLGEADETESLWDRMITPAGVTHLSLETRNLKPGTRS